MCLDESDHILVVCTNLPHFLSHTEYTSNQVKKHQSNGGIEHSYIENTNKRTIERPNERTNVYMILYSVLIKITSNRNIMPIVANSIQ